MNERLALDDFSWPSEDYSDREEGEGINFYLGMSTASRGVVASMAISLGSCLDPECEGLLYGGVAVDEEKNQESVSGL